MTPITLPPPPPEPRAITSTDQLAPKFRTALAEVLMDLAHLGLRPIIRESFRTDERAAWLYGMGRTWDDGRHVVTEAPNGLRTWHRYGLAADVGDRRYEAGQEPTAFWDALDAAAMAHGLTSGRDWNRNNIPDAQEPGKHFCDLPHVQWWCEGMHVSPSDHAIALLQSGGVEAVWRNVGAI